MTTPAAAPQEYTSRRKSLRILYADDLPGLREVTCLTLSSDGHVIECVADGREAMAKLAADPAIFDVVITDHHMPGKSGLELVTWLRTLRFPGRIIVMTAELSPAMGEAYRKLCVDGIVYKPAWPSELRQMVAELGG